MVKGIALTLLRTLDESICRLRDILFVLLLLHLCRNSCMQTVQTLIRFLVLRRLTWVYTICQVTFMVARQMVNSGNFSEIFIIQMVEVICYIYAGQWTTVLAWRGRLKAVFNHPANYLCYQPFTGMPIFVIWYVYLINSGFTAKSKKISNDQELIQSDPISGLKTKREITKYINWQQFTKACAVNRMNSSFSDRWSFSYLNMSLT